MKILGDIQRFIGKKKLTPAERAHFIKDLERVYGRLRSGEYAKHDFTGNTFDIAKRTQEFFDDFEGYALQAKTWAKILGLLAPNSFKTIIDLCPGWSPKIPLALCLADFRGRLIMVDRDTSSIEHVKKMIQFFCPRYSLDAANIDLFGPIDIKAPLVLANHIIDDFTLALADGWSDKSRADHYASEETLIERWRLILGHEERVIIETVPLLCKIFDQMVMPKGAVVITQYRSYTDRLVGLDEAVRFCRKILGCIVKQLCTSGFSRDFVLPQKALKGYDGYFKADDCFVLTRTG